MRSALAGCGTEYQTSTYSSFDHICEVRVRDVEQPVRGDRAEPRDRRGRARRRSSGAARRTPCPAERGRARRPRRGRPRSRRRSGRAARRARASASVREEVCRTAGRRTRCSRRRERIALLDVVELAAAPRGAAAALAVREERGRGARRSRGCPCRSSAFATRSARCVNTRFTRCENFVRCLCMVSAAPRGGRSPTLPAATGDLRLLPLPRRAAAAGGARARAGLRGALLALRHGSARRARVTACGTTSSEPAPAPWARSGRCGDEAGARARGGVRRRLRDRARVARAAESRRRRLLDGRHRRHPADAARARRVVRSPFVYAAIGLPERLAQLRSRAHAAAVRAARSARRPRSSRTASTRRTRSDAGCASGDVDVPVEFVPFGVDARRFRPVERSRPRSTSSRSGRIRTATSSCCSASRATLPEPGFLVVTTGERARSLARPAGERRGRDRPAVRRDAPPARARARRRAPRARQQLLGRDDRAAPGDGARQAGRRHADERRSRPATGSRTARTAGSSRRGTPTAFERALARGAPRRVARPRARRARAGDGRARALRGSATSIGSSDSSARRRSVARDEVARVMRLGRAASAGRAVARVAHAPSRLAGIPPRRQPISRLPRVRAVPSGRRPPVPPRACRASSRAAGSSSSRTVSPAHTHACLFNSFNFDFARLRRFAREGCRMVHRVDGPIGVYRGFDDGTDARIAAVNAELADATVLQSRYSLEKHRELGIELREPVVISEHRRSCDLPSPDRARAARRSSAPRRRDELVDNPRERERTCSRGSIATSTRRSLRVTFVGRSPQPFERIRTAAPARLAAVSRAPARARRLPCREPGRSVLERAARGARVRASRRVPRERRPSRARRRRRAAVHSRRGAPRRARAPRRRARRATARRICVPPIASVADRYLDVLGGRRRATA